MVYPIEEIYDYPNYINWPSASHAVSGGGWSKQGQGAYPVHVQKTAAPILLVGGGLMVVDVVVGVLSVGISRCLYQFC